MNDAVTFGLIMLVLAAIFTTSHSTHPFWKKLYRFVPPILLCYFIPALMYWPLGLINAKASNLYQFASQYLLPASLILFCLGIDLKGILRLGPKALIMFLTGSLGVIIGGPVAVLIFSHFFPGIISATPDELWRGLSCIAGSWIGGSANQIAMKEMFQVPEGLFGTMVVIDVIVAYLWMALLLYGASITNRVDKWLKADTSSIQTLEQDFSDYRSRIEKIPSTTDLFKLMAVAFFGVAIAHWMANLIVSGLEIHTASLKAWRLDSVISVFFWIVVVATTYGIFISFTRFRTLEGVGASKWGSVFLYILVATIGMQMNLKEVFAHTGLLAIGFTWILIHAGLMLLVAKWIRAPFFFMAVGSQANIGAAASAPIVASAFSPSLAPVGVLLGVLGYALGTYGGIICAYLMKAVLGV
jgi:uncharacterized membrane protein